jgi:hypothetical protein
MPLRINHRREEDVPSPNSSAQSNENLASIKMEMSKLVSGTVLEIETGSERAVRGTKMLVTKAAGQLGAKWRHWSVGTKVYAKPAEAVRRRGRRKAE